MDIVEPQRPQQLGPLRFGKMRLIHVNQIGLQLFGRCAGTVRRVRARGGERRLRWVLVSRDAARFGGAHSRLASDGLGQLIDFPMAHGRAYYCSLVACSADVWLKWRSVVAQS